MGRTSSQPLWAFVMSRVVSEAEFAHVLSTRLSSVQARAVTGPGRSGAIASTYASHILGIPFIPYGEQCPDHLRPLLIVDTARKSGGTLRKAHSKYGPKACAVVWCYDEPPRVTFWYESSANLRPLPVGRLNRAEGTVDAGYAASYFQVDSGS